MAISHLIAHHINRPSPSTQAILTLRDEELPRDGKIEECAREFKMSFMKKLSKIHGRFSSDSASHPFSNWLNECVNEKLSFVSLTKKAMEHLKITLDATEVPLEAYVFFVQESFEHADELYVYLVYHNQGQYLDGGLNVSDSIYLDTQNIQLGAKINLREWQDEDQQVNYLSLLILRGEKDLSDAFVEFIGFTDKADIKEETEEFLEVVDSFTSQLPEEAAIEAKEKVVNYCLEQDKAGKRVVMSELSSEVDPNNEKAFINHLKENKPQMKPELIPDRGQLRQYIRISGRNELLSMSFDTKCLGESIVYESDSDTLVIKQIPNALKSRLIKHLKGS